MAETSEPTMDWMLRRGLPALFARVPELQSAGEALRRVRSNAEAFALVKAAHQLADRITLEQYDRSNDVARRRWLDAYLAMSAATAVDLGYASQALTALWLEFGHTGGHSVGGVA